ncbi:CAP domain-containing protein [uncultured Ruminococcus sp.]|uniref:CAP domain-containing protein n=1 Tax=uncultured Ruminococcus sp. TaxID=165186 RepID=UPI0025CFD23F|nr:CAP domain-containing protein [uncultured Ruminococcus sp.]
MKNLKQIIAVTLTVTAVAAAAIVSASALDTQKYDLNDDGRFDVQDVTYLQIKIAGDGELTDNQKTIADYNNDGKIDVQDVTSAQMLISGGETPTQPVTQPTTVQPTSQPQPTTQPSGSASYNKEFADKVIELVNTERAKEGISPLTKDTALTNLSNIRSKEAATLFSHQRPDGTSWSTVLKQNNVSYTSAAENIAAGQNTPEAVVKEWMNSPSHRANIMNSEYNKIGVSCYVDQNAPYRYYWEQLFIKG